ncbi:alpha-amlyase [Roseateles aquatilis]|uniref:Alpha-amlyase n=1 Tax=Roseateles aquatilis TaxID=431061 RepID=A0A246J849_9BURK|nr:glycoside hydrolase family 13 protein [Roseateles aquatilis]OWQ88736.1 alpha-amlyase [Roseateles aquatilis]
MTQNPAAVAATSVASVQAPAPVVLDHVEPPDWWVGMARPELQLMLHGAGIGALQAEIAPMPGVTLTGARRGDSPNYLFLDLRIDAGARPGTLTLRLKRDGQVVLEHPYPLQARAAGSAQRESFGPKDAIYLVVPDRFANGDPRNDQVAGMAEGVRRDDPGGRHGGDLAGLTAHLDYIAAMGFTMLWPTPLSENNSPKWSYHGYGATDFYKTDPRFGSNADYVALSLEARRRGIGLIQDIVLNHIGVHHWWMADLPTTDWINVWPQYTETHHARMTLQDPYAAPSDRKRFSDGWFSPGMPDLNQRQPLVATYLTQMSLWWIERAGLAGVRTDTYSYSDKDFLAAWSRRLKDEYPRLNIVGEEWSPHPAVVSYWQAGKVNHDGYVSSLPSLMDFPLQEALLAGLNQADSHDGGFTRIYEALAHDFVYPDAGNLVLFEGNHDTPRLYSALHEDVDLTRMAWAYLSFVRRIPQFFYGTEILMTSPRHRDDGVVRADFPGGWPGDTVNAFTGAGLSERQRDAQAFLKRLLNWRKSEPLVHGGALMQYAPMANSYVLFRYDAAKGLRGRRLMLVLHKGREPQELALDRFPEMLRGGETATDVITGERRTLGRTLTLPAKSVTVLSIE